MMVDCYFSSNVMLLSLADKGQSANSGYSPVSCGLNIAVDFITFLATTPKVHENTLE